MNETGHVLDVESTTPDGVIPLRAVVRDGIIHFYDRRYRFTENGQYTGANYHLETFAERTGALQLHGGVPTWYLDERTYSHIQAWLYINHHVNRIGEFNEA